jgi:hypothetical protein
VRIRLLQLGGERISVFAALATEIEAANFTDGQILLCALFSIDGRRASTAANAEFSG